MGPHCCGNHSEEMNIEELTVTYEQLSDLECEFEDVDAEIIRQQVKLTAPLYEKRAALISKIPNFWPLVLEQAPHDIDEYIQPSDSALILAALKDLKVTHFEIEGATAVEGGDPRSLCVRMEFCDNDHFEDKVLEKKFWYRHDKDGWAGLVSEPVDIKWKPGKDLTDGMLGLVKKVREEEKAAEAAGKKVEGWTVTRKALKEKIDNTGLGGLSFFAWFGFIGPRVSAETSKVAEKEEREKRRLRQEGKATAEDEDMEDDDDEEETEEEIQEELEIFPGGDDLAVQISEDLYQSAIKYFTQAQEMEEFGSDMEEDEDDEDDEAPELSKE